MLHLNTIDEETSNVLHSLLEQKYLADFSLVGGTSLSLRYGHRRSIDLDLFSPVKFDPLITGDLLQIDYPDYTYRGNNTYMLFCNIGKIKIDLVYHPFALLSPIETIYTIRMFSIKDIAAKCFAICKRGTRKDMYDMWVLLQHFTAKQIIDFFVKKYGEEKLIFFQKSILYFEEADKSEQPEIFVKGLDWNKVKQTVYKSFVHL